ncbi:hypothetical protein [Streptomyces violaceus]|uniref:Uncharacterized protein n=1 Tax=Streptomyces violaceus TaxID=1936 RepID=A0ABY9UD59_STRVL|nr:hypothetical protein [Streptomyces janthinus]WND20600.1 hypothetical protein RI060_26115 [Streptomyces janthinus]GGS52056.1 hypothetical protein GCM10010270_23350 [Streptomyces janthinus]
MHERQWITARRSELDTLAEQLTKQLQEVQVERDELAIAERVFNRLAEQAQAGAKTVAPAAVQVAGRAVLLIRHRSDAADGAALPGGCRSILAIVREADGAVQVKALAPSQLPSRSWPYTAVQNRTPRPFWPNLRTGLNTDERARIMP